ncbi:MAG: Ig-like domain-containing protein [Oscillospiraceae bacterium]|nr:Ig-like domain-containing protein [Oscillospiraceae bacterium]
MKLKALRGVLLEKWRKSDKRIVIAGGVLIFSVVSILAIVSQKNTDEASNEIELKSSGYAMVLQHYSGFDMSETNTALKLNWDNGVARLENGKAQLKLSAKIYPINLENKDIEWQTSNVSIASIDDDGNITVTAPGEVQFRATLVESGKTADAILNVLQPVTGLFLPTTSVQMYTTDPGRLLSYVIFPENATNSDVSWESNNPDIVSVDENGRIKPESTGSAVITATTDDGGYQRICHVTVSSPSVEVEEINLQNKDDATVEAGKSLQLTAVPKPSNAKNRTPLKWTSSDESIATVSQSGRVSGVSAGTAVITVASTNGKTDTIEITVTPSDEKDALNLNDTITSVSKTPSDGEVTYTSYSMTLPMMVKIQMSLNPPPKLWSSGSTRNATEEEVAEYMNPNEFYTGSYKYQFLDLSQSNGVSADVLNDFLADKGILSGQGEAFISAAEEFGVSEVYLVAHACLESGNGTSQLASGVEYNGVTVYNMFGIGAYDSDAVGGGSQRAYELGWTSVEAAIRGGAEWISDNYINSPDGAQNTLYKMLWNPENPGTHQYATDISWAVKQAANIEKIFDDFPEAVLSYDVPVYSGMVPPVLE